jgi:hypothetical protein
LEVSYSHWLVTNDQNEAEVRGITFMISSQKPPVTSV